MERVDSDANDKPKSKRPRTSNNKYYENNRSLYISRAKQWKIDHYEEAKLTDKYKDTRRRLNKKYYEQRKLKSQQSMQPCSDTQVLLNELD